MPDALFSAVIEFPPAVELHGVKSAKESMSSRLKDLGQDAAQISVITGEVSLLPHNLGDALVHGVKSSATAVERCCTSRRIVGKLSTRQIRLWEGSWSDLDVNLRQPLNRQ
jgi:hypothetical protein